jgi:hypothetical protein
MTCLGDHRLNEAYYLEFLIDFASPFQVLIEASLADRIIAEFDHNMCYYSTIAAAHERM